MIHNFLIKKRYIYLVSSKSLLYALIFGRNMYKGLISWPLQPIKYLKSFLIVTDITLF